MSRKREAVFMGIGILAGVTLCGPAAQAATEAITAALSNQPIYVNGQKAEFEAYTIHGNNFVKLRDIAEAVDFGVTYDAAANSVYIDPDAPYQEEVKQTEPTSPSPALTEESIQAAIRALRDVYPTNTYYGDFYRSYSNGPYGMAPDHCAGWATLCSDAAFGNLPWRRINNPGWEDIRVGDLIRFNTDSSGHVVVVLEKTDEYVKVTESGTNNKARWGGKYFRWWLEEQPGYTCFTRYPN